MRRNAFEHDDPDRGTRDAALRQACESIGVLAATLGNCADWVNSRYGLTVAKARMR